MTLDFADVGKDVRGFGILIPARVERQDIPFKHTLKQPNDRGAISENEPVLINVSTKFCETEFLVESL